MELCDLYLYKTILTVVGEAIVCKGTLGNLVNSCLENTKKASDIDEWQVACLAVRGPKFSP